MMLGTITKQPNDLIDFDIDFTDWLADRADDVIDEVFVRVAPEAQLQLIRTDIVGAVVKQWIAAGFDSTTYQVTAAIYTVAGRIKEVEVRVRVKEV